MIESSSIISQNVRAIRKALKLSSKQFSELINISIATLANIESGKKTFRLESLTGIIDILSIPLKELSNVDYIVDENLREDLISKYESNPDIKVILGYSPSIAEVLKSKVLNTKFLDSPKETNEIRSFLLKMGLDFKANSLHITLKRMPNLIDVLPHATKKGTFLYQKRKQP